MAETRTRGALGRWLRIGCWVAAAGLLLIVVFPAMVILRPWSNHPGPSALGRAPKGWIIPRARGHLKSGGWQSAGGEIAISLARDELVLTTRDRARPLTDHGDGTAYDWDDDGAWYLEGHTPLEEAVRIDDTVHDDVFVRDRAHEVFVADTCAEGQRRAGLLEWRGRRITVHADAGDRVIVTPCTVERAVLSPDREWVAFLYYTNGITSGKDMNDLGLAHVATGEVARLSPLTVDGVERHGLGSHPPLQWVERIPDAFIIHREPLAPPAG